MEFCQRKPNRFPEYDYATNGAYFVTVCTQDRRKILSDIVGDGFPVPKPTGLIAEEFIHKIPKKYPTVSVDRYIIMPDHIHLLFMIEGGTGDPSPTLGNIIGWYKYQVTKEVNRKTKIAGEKLFQRSYYDHIIRNQQDYNEIAEYIDTNPLRWIFKKRGYE